MRKQLRFDYTRCNGPLQKLSYLDHYTHSFDPLRILKKMWDRHFFGLLWVTQSLATVTYIQPAQVQPLGSGLLNKTIAVPGNSPFVYMRDTTRDLLSIQSLDMYPTRPYIPSTVALLLHGGFHEDLPNISLAFIIVSYFKDGTSGRMRGGDDLCNNWAVIKQATSWCSAMPSKERTSGNVHKYRPAERLGP